MGDKYIKRINKLNKQLNKLDKLLNKNMSKIMQIHFAL